MYKIVCTADCVSQAKAISDALGETELLLIDDIVSDPESLGDFTDLGIVFSKAGKGIPDSVHRFIRDVLSEYDLRGLDYMFSICVTQDGPAHALKIVEKLCSKVGCAPSISTVLRSPDEIPALVQHIKNSDIILARGTIGTMFYMRAHGIK